VPLGVLGHDFLRIGGDLFPIVAFTTDQVDSGMIAVQSQCKGKAASAVICMTCDCKIHLANQVRSFILPALQN